MSTNVNEVSSERGPLQRSLFDSRRERDLGIARVTHRNVSWMDRALSLLPQMKRVHSEVTGEDIRVWLLANGLDEPTKPNAWGALTRRAVQLGLLADTGRIRQMTEVQSHARRTPIWRFV